MATASNILQTREGVKPRVYDMLVVDDDVLIRSLIAEWLAAAGYSVREAEHGKVLAKPFARQDLLELVREVVGTT
jgi:CheY-like chemotaxis protein